MRNEHIAAYVEKTQINATFLATDRLPSFRERERSRRSTDRMHPCGGCDVGSIPAGSTNTQKPASGRFLRFALSERCEASMPSRETGSRKLFAAAKSYL